MQQRNLTDREAACHGMVGHFERDGHTVYYVNEKTWGQYTGTRVEFNNEGGAVAFLIRNRYV